MPNAETTNRARAWRRSFFVSCIVGAVLLLAAFGAHYLLEPDIGSDHRAATTGHVTTSALAASSLPGYEQLGLNNFAAAMQRQMATENDTLHAVPVLANVPAPTEDEATETVRTCQRYYDLFGRGTFESFFGAGIETGNPIPKNLGQQWNSLKDSGLYDADFRRRFIQKMQQLGICNLRIGLSNHEIFKQYHGVDGPWDDASWRQMDAIISDLSAGGIKLCLDLHHFGIERMFQTAAQPSDPKTDFVKDGINYSKSFYLNPKWPEYFADFAAEAYRRYHDKVFAFTLINEPETTNGFQSQMWNGGQPGWFSKEHMKLYIERGMQIGLAAVLARTRMETLSREFNASPKHRLLFIQSEAAQYKSDDPQFSLYCRFMTLDMILGQHWLIDADLQTFADAPLDQLGKRWFARSTGPKSMLEWLIYRYIFQQSPDNRELRRTFLVTHLKQLQDAHRQLAAQFPGTTMQSATVLGIDYYAQNESRIAATKIREKQEAQRMAHDNASPSTGNDIESTPADLDPEPENYAAEIRSGDRLGLYGNALAYWERYRTMPLATTENGTAWWGEMSTWHKQQLLEEGLIQQRHHIPFLAHFIYPLMDVRGWENDRALSLEPQFSEIGQTGLMDQELVTRPNFELMLSEMRELWGH